MRLQSVLITMALAGMVLPAHAEMLECIPNSYADLFFGEATAHNRAESDISTAGFTIDLKTGAYHQNWTDGTDPQDLTYEIISWGAYGDESPFIAWNKATASLIRIRLTNEELQFSHDHDSVVEMGTCSFLSRDRQFECMTDFCV